MNKSSHRDEKKNIFNILTPTVLELKTKKKYARYDKFEVTKKYINHCLNKIYFYFYFTTNLPHIYRIKVIKQYLHNNLHDVWDCRDQKFKFGKKDTFGRQSQMELVEFVFYKSGLVWRSLQFVQCCAVDSYSVQCHVIEVTKITAG